MGALHTVLCARRIGLARELRLHKWDQQWRRDLGQLRGRSALVFALLFSLASMAPRSLRAEEEEALAPRRTEVTAVPVISYDSDTGLLLGGFTNIAHFERGAVPYDWRLEVLLSASVKHDDSGFSLPLHNDSLSLDLPGLRNGDLRMSIDAYFSSYSDGGWYGPGGNSMALQNPPQARYYDYARVYPGSAVNTRWRLWEIAHDEARQKLEGLLGAQLDYSHVTADPGSLLADQIQEAQTGTTADAATLRNILRGTNNHFLGKLRLGLIYDSRDNEFHPTRGFFFEAAARIVPAPSSLAHVGFFTSATGFFPLINDWLVAGGRAFVDAIVGNPPFYALTEAGVFSPFSAPGGSSSLRGVLLQRYAGKIKLVASAELRAQLFRFTLFQQRFRFGVSAFTDAGRVFADWHEVILNGVNVDGPWTRFATGVGGGLRLTWGETLVVRADFAWSPSDKTAGQYISVGELF